VGREKSLENPRGGPHNAKGQTRGVEEPLMITCRTVADLQALEELRAPWERLTAGGAGDPLFGSHLWNSLWWKHYAGLGELRTLVAEQDGEVVAIWPLFLADRTFGEVEIDMIGPRRMPLPGKGLRLRTLAYLGSGEICSDFLAPIVLPNLAAPALDALAAHLAAQRDWDLLDLPDMLADNPTLPALRAALSHHLTKPRERFRYHAPYAPLAPTYDEYLDSLSKKGRYNARKKLRQLQLNHRVEHCFHSDPATLPAAMDEFIRLHQERWNADGLPGVFVNERFIGFHRDLAARLLERGALRLGFLRVNGQAVFATYGFQIGDRVYLYQQGGSADRYWDNYNLGYVALGFAMADAVERGARVYDFLRGNAEYKQHWAKEHRDLVQWQAARRGVRGRLFLAHSYVNTDDRWRARMKKMLGGS